MQIIDCRVAPWRGRPGDGYHNTAPPGLYAFWWHVPGADAPRLTIIAPLRGLMGRYRSLSGRAMARPYDMAENKYSLHNVREECGGGSGVDFDCDGLAYAGLGAGEDSGLVL